MSENKAKEVGGKENKHKKVFSLAWNMRESLQKENRIVGPTTKSFLRSSGNKIELMRGYNEKLQSYPL